LRFGDGGPFGSEDTPAHLLVKSRQGSAPSWPWWFRVARAGRACGARVTCYQ
jgi:hypothetical protein